MIQKVTYEDVLLWRRRFSRVTKVVLTGGWPCVNHSALNANRLGTEGASSKLLDNLLEIRSWLKSCSKAENLPEWDVIEFYENVVMDDEDFKVQSKKIGFLPYFVEAADVGRCRRVRLYWVRGLSIIHGDDLHEKGLKTLRDHDYMVKYLEIDTERPPLSWFLNENTKKAELEDEAFATFTRPIARQQPPDQPAGIESASERALKMWKGDSYRLPPYQYEKRNLVVDANGPRRLNVEEQLRMMGFFSNHLTTKTRLSADARGQMIGNSFSAIVVARLLAGLVLDEASCSGEDVTLRIWQVWLEKEKQVKLEDKPWKVRFASVAAGVPGVVSLRHQVLPPPQLQLRTLVDPQGWLTDEEMLTYLLARNGAFRCGEIRVDLGMAYAVGEICRQSINPSHWTWKVLLSYKWKQGGQHINTLEVTAVLDLLRKLGRDAKYHGHKLIILVDNQVAISCITKGRSSARGLQGPLRRLSAVCLVGHFRLCLGWIKSKWNPADGPSRWAVKRRHA